MRLATRTLESLITATQSVIQAPNTPGKSWKKFERILKRHDRKGELLARILSITPEHYRELQKRLPLEQLVRQCGFRDSRSFALALLGKLKDELHLRGWSQARIERMLGARSQSYMPAF